MIQKFDSLQSTLVGTRDFSGAWRKRGGHKKNSYWEIRQQKSGGVDVCREGNKSGETDAGGCKLVKNRPEKESTSQKRRHINRRP